MKKLPRKKDGLLRCWICGEYKPINEFYKDRAKPEGRMGACKSCWKEYTRDYQHQYYLSHRDILLPRHRKSALESYYRRKKRGTLD